MIRAERVMWDEEPLELVKNICNIADRYTCIFDKTRDNFIPILKSLGHFNKNSLEQTQHCIYLTSLTVGFYSFKGYEDIEDLLISECIPILERNDKFMKYLVLRVIWKHSKDSEGLNLSMKYSNAFSIPILLLVLSGTCFRKPQSFQKNSLFPY